MLRTLSHRQWTRLPSALCLILATASLAFAQSAPSSGEKEVGVRVITNWTTACSADTVSSWDDMLHGWYDDITDTRSTPSGHSTRAWVTDTFKTNGTIVDSDFVDASLVSWGNDTASGRIDEVDAFMLGMHGFESGSSYGGSVRKDEAGSGNCYFYSYQMEFDSDVEFVHLSSCHSMCDDNYRDWNSAIQRAHLITGFHGIMWISTSYTSRYKNFSDDSFNGSIADSWVDNHYDKAHWYEPWQTYDHCPTARGVGNSESDLWNRMDNEEYDSVFSDPSTSGTRWYGLVYIEDCDPKGDSAIFD